MQDFKVTEGFWSNLDCINFFYIHSKQKSNININLFTFLIHRKWCETTGRQSENT